MLSPSLYTVGRRQSSETILEQSTVVLTGGKIFERTGSTRVPKNPDLLNPDPIDQDWRSEVN